MSQPIKRHPSLQPLSREHHLGLLLCWKIGKGFTKGVEPERMMKYATWFYNNHLLPHFETEEKNIFPILGEQHELIQKALEDHRRLRSLFEDHSDIIKTLQFIETELEQHIRFEERILFNEIQQAASPDQLQIYAELHKEENFCENEEDAFWL